MDSDGAVGHGLAGIGSGPAAPGVGIAWFGGVQVEVRSDVGPLGAGGVGVDAGVKSEGQAGVGVGCEGGGQLGIGSPVGGGVGVDGGKLPGSEGGWKGGLFVEFGLLGLSIRAEYLRYC